MKGRRVLWTEVWVSGEPGSWGISLDTRAMQTPGRRALTVASRPLAEAMAAEWRAQKVTVDPLTMPLTRIANTAIDRVAPQRAAIAQAVAAYGGSDLICYRATGPDRLVARQSLAWDPLLAWAGDTLGAPLVATSGVMPVAQPAESLSVLTARVMALAAAELSALHDLVALSGSLVIGLAVREGYLPAEAAWDLSRLDERFQAEEWGSDAEAEAAAAAKRADFLAAARFLRLLQAAEAPEAMNGRDPGLDVP